jgi:hypothetical protein
MRRGDKALARPVCLSHRTGQRGRVSRRGPVLVAPEHDRPRMPICSVEQRPRRCIADEKEPDRHGGGEVVIRVRGFAAPTQYSYVLMHLLGQLFNQFC